MKKVLLFVLATLSLGMVAFAKNENIEIMPSESIVYTLEEKDSLNVDLIIDETGMFYLELTSLTTTGEFPAGIEVILTEGNKTISEFKAEDGFVEKRYLMLTGLNEGEYLLKIKNLTFFGDVSFEIVTKHEAFAYVENSISDSFENATELERGRKYHGGVYGKDVYDFYSFEMPDDGYAFVRMYSPSFKYFTLYDENKEVIGVVNAEIENPENVYEQRIGLAKGKYYISVTPKRDYFAPEYTLEVVTYADKAFECEYNNTTEKADVLETGKEYKANLFGTDDVDIFSFELAGKSDVKIKLFDTYYNKAGHYNFRLLDEKENVILNDVELNSKNYDISLDKGKYFIEITSPGEDYFTSMGYVVSVNFKSNSDDDGEDKEETPNVKEDETPTEPAVQQFFDVKENDWFAKDVLAAKEKGLVNGVSENNFYPHKEVSLAEAITMAIRFAYPEVNHDDVLENEKWYTPYVNKAVEAKLIGEAEFDNFDVPATRAQMAYIFSGLVNDDEQEVQISVPDVDENVKYHENIFKLYRNGVLLGNDETGTFYPDKNISRAEAVVILLRVSEI